MPPSRSTGSSPRFRFSDRAAGVLLHPTSLPGPHGCGDLGPAAFEFAEFLSAAGMRWWQMLPVNPPDRTGSPYAALSAFAGSPLLVSLEQLARDGLLERRDLRGAKFRDGKVDFLRVAKFRLAALRRAHQAFRSRAGDARREFDQFCGAHAAWLNDYALYAALRSAHDGREWPRWPTQLRMHNVDAVRDWSDRNADAVECERFIQYVFSRQWRALRARCAELGVGLIGDIPIFVGHDSADVWAHRDLFTLDSSGRPKLITGVPPDDFSKTGQLWRHPHYNWPRHLDTKFSWWVERFRAIGEQFDAVRIDHFIGFHRCWAVSGGARTAARGRWLLTPGRELLMAVQRSLGPLEVIAEDLGAVTPETAHLRDEMNYPGMRILHWAFGYGPGARHNQPHNLPRRCVVYPGTHDNNTTVGWFEELKKRRRERGPDGLSDQERTLRYTGGDGREVHWDMIRLALASPADTAIFQLQDVLGLGKAARMNLPATEKGNWSWRFVDGALKASHARRLRELAETYERVRPT